ncbi:Co/Zn/Cd efflux system component [Pseudoxanthomonas japonensis]|jgi:Co/Zn/Cd efflux system component|uniref:cation transporter n=1 Tax=Pseudoxanthomonas japonensis TaxID=69284 RepID=UPI0028668780|nr:cation transporter [Pseudoxanthomonas japonensis]MDR7070353.1 Co/Zn/Cd efflux system component [Pseudoxanthomonas japonensis]
MDECCSKKGDEIAQLALKKDQRRVLLIVLAINALMFFIEFGAGIIAHSSALQADAVDMLGDALVYALSLYVINRGAKWEAGAALAKGGLILFLFAVIVVEIILKLIHGVPPSSKLMLIFGSLALLANLTCLALLWRFRKLNVNMSSTFECSRNDVAANFGVLLAAAGVAWLNSPWPDIVVGSIIALIFLRSAIRVIRGAWPQFKASR